MGVMAAHCAVEGCAATAHDAARVCVSCGRTICVQHRQPFGGETHCPDCLRPDVHMRRVCYNGPVPERSGAVGWGLRLPDAGQPSEPDEAVCRFCADDAREWHCPEFDLTFLDEQYRPKGADRSSRCEEATMPKTTTQRFARLDAAVATIRGSLLGDVDPRTLLSAVLVMTRETRKLQAENLRLRAALRVRAAAKAQKRTA
jgi:hypothetical protein